MIGEKRKVKTVRFAVKVAYYLFRHYKKCSKRRFKWQAAPLEAIKFRCTPTKLAYRREHFSIKLALSLNPAEIALNHYF
jgi:hypothetical protein